jgi:SAM-dependent methyltransferase
MRVAATAKAGYYPTPTSIIAFLVSRLEYQPKAALLDPCCGTGEALSRLAAIVGGSSTGLEPDAERAALARTRLSSLHHGDALAFDARGFSLLFLNPSYDSDAGERLELRFLWHFTPALVTGGLLVFIIPESILDEVCPHLEHHFNRLGVYRFPGDEYEAFRQVIVVGHRRDPRLPAGVLPDVAVSSGMKPKPSPTSRSTLSVSSRPPKCSRMNSCNTLTIKTTRMTNPDFWRWVKRNVNGC